MKISEIVKNTLDFLQKYIWLLTVFFYIQGTVYYSEYLNQLHVDTDYYPINFEQVLSNTMVMYLQQPFLVSILLCICLGVIAIFINDKFINWTKLKFSSFNSTNKHVKSYTEKDLIKPLEVNKPNKIQRYGINILVIAYSLFVFLIVSIIPAALVAKVDAEDLLAHADKQIELMKNDKSSVKSNIKIKCDSVSKSFSGPFFNIKSSTLYHSIYDGETTITIPNSCIEFRSTNHKINTN